MQEVDTEWRLLQNTDLRDFNFTDETDVVDFWSTISKIKSATGENEFGKLSTFVFNLLCLPHSTANVERIFSAINLNRTKLRNRLKTETLEGLLYTKSLVLNSGKCYDFNISPDLIKQINPKIKSQEEPTDCDSDSSV